MELGYGSGSGYGSYGAGYGYGSSGSGAGSGSGYGAADGDSEYLTHARFKARRALDLPNAEMRRVVIERIGPESFFTELDASVVHADMDGHGHPRRLLRVPLADAEAGYLQAVQVVCPTTGRVYHLGVQPGVRDCQEAVASLFGLLSHEYAPVRET